MELAVTPLEDARGATAGRVLVFRDVTERRELERELRRLAYTDRLTGLPNRALLHDRLEQALAMARRRDAPVAVLFLDLDRFKNINDSLGHEIGDKVLIAVAHRLRGCLRAEDTLARLGGDEFAILLPEIADRRDTYLVTEKCLAALSAPEVIGGHELTVNASIGVAVFPQDGADVQHLLRSADAAMYRAKARGGGRAETFTHLLEKEVTRRHQIEVELHRLKLVNAILDRGRHVFGQDFLSKINVAVRHERGVGYRHVETVVVRPGDDIGRLAAHAYRRQQRSGGLGALPSLLTRLALRGVPDEEADLLSYLFFDRSFTAELIALGREDARRSEDAILELLAG